MRAFSNFNTHLVLIALSMQLICSGIQSQELSKTELEERANAYFENKEFVKAAADYEVLNDMFPKENSYAYLLGRSYLDANMELVTAVESLKNVAVRNYGNDSYFHLARVYHKTYQFDEAMHAMRTFKNMSSNKTIKSYAVDHWMLTIENARKSILVARKLNVEDMQDIPAVSPESAFVDKAKGKYIYVPQEFMTSKAKELDYKSLMYLSDDIEIGDYLYFSSVSKNGKNGSDIYRVRRITAEDFSIPELLPEIINTPYDEAHPFFDKASSSLFFATNGDLSAGGFDIVKSYYDAGKNSWSKPQALDFPINSVHDDYLYTTLNRSNEVIFLSRRNSIGENAHAYTVVIDTLATYEIPANTDEVLSLALLMPTGISVEDENIHLAQISPFETEAQAESTTISLYNQLINEALSLQMKSDSLDWIAKEMQMVAVEGESDKARLARINGAEALEFESQQLQNLADEKFRQAEELKVAELNNSDETSNLLASNATKDAGLVHYTYKPDDEVSIAEQVGKSSASLALAESQNMLAGSSTDQEIKLGFSIAQSSPYSASNPIPETNLPEGLVYRIQLGAFSKDIPQNTFGGLSPVSHEQVGTSTKYYVGYFKSVADARNALSQVKDYGYPDAFIVSYYQNKKITIQKAREIEFAAR